MQQYAALCRHAGTAGLEEERAAAAARLAIHAGVVTGALHAYGHQCADAGHSAQQRRGRSQLPPVLAVHGRHLQHAPAHDHVLSCDLAQAVVF